MKENRRKEKGAPRGTSDKVVEAIAYVVLTIFALVAILPCLHVISKAFSKGTYVTAGLVSFFPRGFQLETINYILYKTDFFNALKNSLIITIVGTFISVVTTITTAYPLSKPQFKGRKVVTLLYVFSMVFYGGMIPAYMVVKTLGLLDTYAACILPFAIVQFNMFIVKNYFEALPESVEESARIDGANDLKILFSIVTPMSKPVIATVSLLYAITYWNNYFHAMMYTQSKNMTTLQVFLKELIKTGSAYTENLAGGTLSENITSEGMVASAVTLSLIPIVLFYPFVQRYLTQGITVGSVKG
jgi:putative aldouronate transport system permease protein